MRGWVRFIGGQWSIAARKLKYFQDREFVGIFDPA
jgi:hypothetical protein